MLSDLLYLFENSRNIGKNAYYLRHMWMNEVFRSFRSSLEIVEFANFSIGLNFLLQDDIVLLELII